MNWYPHSQGWRVAGEPSKACQEVAAHSAEVVCLHQLRRCIAEIILQGRCAPAGGGAAKANQLPGAGAGEPDEAGRVDGAVDHIVSVQELQGLCQAVDQHHAICMTRLLLCIQLTSQQILHTM